jgi:hypothetical protein
METAVTRDTVRSLSVEAGVDAPADFTLAFARGYFARTFLGRDSGPVTLDFALPLGGGMTLAKPVTVSFADSEGEGIHVRWAPVEGGAFPTFSGQFETAPREGGRCTLTVSGFYVPPGGVAGRIFDALLGYRIATSSLGALLARIGEAAERDYRTRVAL